MPSVQRPLAEELLQNGRSELLRAEFENVLEEVAPDEVILDIANLDALAVVLNVCNERRIPWHFVPSFDQLVFGNSRTHLIAGIPLVASSRSIFRASICLSNGSLMSVWQLS